MDEYNNFRSCIIREKKIFRSMIGELDLKKNPGAITDYLEKHFKQKEALKKQRQMMGAQGGDDLLKQKIQKMEEDSMQVTKKRIDTMDFSRKREVMAMGGGAGNLDNKQEEDKYI
jgi:hypothetical protein